MDDFGTDSRMQARECSGLHDRVKGVKTAERPIKAHPGTFHGIFTSFPAFHSLHSPLCASFQGPESPVKLPVKIRIKIQTHSKSASGFRQPYQTKLVGMRHSPHSNVL